jgi:hypothetical protein
LRNVPRTMFHEFLLLERKKRVGRSIRCGSVLPASAAGVAGVVRVRRRSRSGSGALRSRYVPSRPGPTARAGLRSSDRSSGSRDRACVCARPGRRPCAGGWGSWAEHRARRAHVVSLRSDTQCPKRVPGKHAASTSLCARIRLLPHDGLPERLQSPGAAQTRGPGSGHGPRSQTWIRRRSGCWRPRSSAKRWPWLRRSRVRRGRGWRIGHSCGG